MIKIIKGDTPIILKGKNCRKKVAQSITQKEFIDGYYNHSDVLAELELTHHGKCCYCENKIRPTATPQVEHYSPKKTLKDDKTHLGYYWLGHEWENLLLVCPACNQAKSSWFPIKGNRVTAPTLTKTGKLSTTTCIPNQLPLSEEQPLIINPEYDADPERHFQFGSDGVLSGITPEGKMTIEKCKLNERSLPFYRKKIIDKYIEGIEEVFVGYIEKDFDYNRLLVLLKRKIQKMIKESMPNAEYTLIRTQSLVRFETFYIAQFPNTFKSVLRTVFEQNI